MGLVQLSLLVALAEPWLVMLYVVCRFNYVDRSNTFLSVVASEPLTP